MPRISETLLQSSSFWEARCALIGQLSCALWLAKYLKRVTKILRPLSRLSAAFPSSPTKDKRQTGSHSFPMESSAGAVWSSDHMRMQKNRIRFELRMY